MLNLKIYFIVEFIHNILQSDVTFIEVSSRNSILATAADVCKIVTTLLIAAATDGKVTTAAAIDSGKA